MQQVDNTVLNFLIYVWVDQRWKTWIRREQSTASLLWQDGISLFKMCCFEIVSRLAIGKKGKRDLKLSQMVLARRFVVKPMKT